MTAIPPTTSSAVISRLTVMPKQTTDFYVFYRDKNDNQPDLDPTNKIDPEGSLERSSRAFRHHRRAGEIQAGCAERLGLHGEVAYENGDVYQTDAQLDQIRS